MELELYKKDTCPFCQRVLRAIKASGRTDIVLKDIKRDEGAHEYLIEKGGQDQVPCLFIDGKPLYESLDIIRWLEEHPQEKKGLEKLADKLRSADKKKPQDRNGSW